MNVKLRCQISYGRRNLLLKSMGYSNYNHYLQSDLWNKIRTKVFARDQSICFGCGDRASQVHHANYNREVLKGKTLKELYSVCSECHSRIEYTSNGVKVDPSTATALLKEIRKSNLGVGGLQGNSQVDRRIKGGSDTNPHKDGEVSSRKIVKNSRKKEVVRLTTRGLSSKMKVLDKVVMEKLENGLLCGKEHGKNCLCVMYRMF